MRLNSLGYAMSSPARLAQLRTSCRLMRWMPSLHWGHVSRRALAATPRMRPTPADGAPRSASCSEIWRAGRAGMSTCHVSKTARPWRCSPSLDADPSTAASRWLCARRACVAIWPSRWPSVRRRVSRTRRARCRPCSWSRSGEGRFEYRGTGGGTSAGAKLPRWPPPPPLPRPLPLLPLWLPLLKRARRAPVAWARRRARRRRRHPPVRASHLVGAWPSLFHSGGGARRMALCRRAPWTRALPRVRRRLACWLLPRRAAG